MYSRTQTMRPWVLSCFVSLVPTLLHANINIAFNSPLFYRANNFFGEPRLEQDFLFSFDFTFGGGDTRCGHDCHGQKTGILNLHGVQNLQFLGVGVAKTAQATPTDTFLLNSVAELPTNGTFGTVAFNGHFRFLEANVIFSQNLVCGFFLQCQLPIRYYKIDDICMTDLSPTDQDTYPNSTTPLWQAYLNSLPTILSNYGIALNPAVQVSGVGDIILLAGLTRNLECFENLDYFDVTLKGGILAPSSPKENLCLAFAIPLGYNGHWAVPLIADFAIGSYDWITLGAHASTAIFFDATHALRIPTSVDQSGYIKLQEVTANIHKGLLWQAGMYAKADHIIQGFSGIFGYSYATQDADSVLTCNQNCFASCIVDSDCAWSSWHMHTLHFIFEYDFATCRHPYAPSLAFFGNWQIGGKNTYNTDMYGFIMGLDVAWRF